MNSRNKHIGRSSSHSIAPQKWLGMYLLVAILALAGCGGSSSTTEQKNTLPSPVAGGIEGTDLVPGEIGQQPLPAAELEALPLITLAQRQFADPNVLLNLRGTVTAAPGATIVATLWTQVTGPQVLIPSPLQLNNEILVPDVNVATTLEFRLTAQDSKGKINSATTSILVKPVPTFVKVIGGVFNETDAAAVFTLRLNAASSMPVTLSYTTQDGTANSGSDYVLTAGELIFAAGEISKTISVPLIDDPLKENDESFSLQVTAIDGTITHANRGMAIIHNGSEAPLPQTLQFSNPTPAAIKVNSQLANPLLPSPGSGAVLYSSANAAIATVDANGLVSAFMPGTTSITAIKASDDIYAAAEISYTLTINTGSSPFVSIFNGSFAWQHIKAKQGEPLSFYGYISDSEDYNPSGHSWDSDLDGFLGMGYYLDTDTLSQGLHTLSETVTANGDTFQNRALVAVGELTRTAAIVDSIPSTCEFLKFFNDPQAITDLYFGTHYYDTSCAGVSTLLTWASPVTINKIHLHLRTDRPLQNYTVEYWDQNTPSWKTLTPTGSSIVNTDNGDGSDETLRQEYLTGAITTGQLRILQPDYGSITELLVFGTEMGTSIPAAQDINPITLQLGGELNLVGRAFDKEDSSLATQTDLLRWSSDIDGALGTGNTLNTLSLQQGLHLISLSASDSDGNTGTASLPVLVGNVAPAATADANSERCFGGTCYRVYNINDNSLTTDAGLYHSWINMGLEFLSPGESEWVSLTWSSPVTTNTIDLYSTQGQVIQAYDIEYRDAQQNWVKVVSVTDNGSVHRSHAIASITTSQLRVIVLKGSVAEPGLARINELVVFGTQAAAITPPPLAQTIQFIKPESTYIQLGSQYVNPINSTLMLGSGAVSYTSSNPQVATVDSSGLVTATAPGTITITAIKAGDSVYAEAKASYELQVLTARDAPIITIYYREQPVDSISVHLGEPVYLSGNVVDKNGAYFEGIVPSWSSSLDGSLVTDWGNISAEFGSLSQGTHTITLSISDGAGNFMGRKTIQVIVGNAAP